MKKIKLIITCLAFISFLACDQEDEPFHNIYDNTGQTGLGFTQTNSAVIVPVNGSINLQIGVQATNTSASDRSFNVTVDQENSFGDSGDYTIGTITIPANSYDGSLALTFNDDDLVDLVAYTLIVKLEIPEGIAVIGSDTATINYNRYLVRSSTFWTMVEDFYSDERTWEVVDDMGNVVFSGGPYAQGGNTYTENFYLDDGCYTFTIYDAYGDGQSDGNITGSYSLDCSIINLAYGEGNWGGSASTDFCINP